MVARMPPPFRRRTAKKEPRRSPRPTAALEERIDHAAALEWLTSGLELALRTGDPESALEQLRPLRASCLSALERPSDEVQQRTAQANRGNTGAR
jgi:hypothetical protein